MSDDARKSAVRTAILEFDWGNYGLDDLDRRVNPDLSDEYADDLADDILKALEKMAPLMTVHGPLDSDG